jgi:hypothetical protein
MDDECVNLYLQLLDRCINHEVGFASLALCGSLVTVSSDNSTEVNFIFLRWLFYSREFFSNALQ